MTQPRRLLKTTNEPHEYILEIDYSGISSFMECQRRGENYLIHSREASKDQSATNFGRLFHELEELRLRHGFSDSLVQLQKEKIATHFLNHPPPPTDHRTSDMMLKVINVYNSRYINDGWPNRVPLFNGEPMIERPFKIPLCTIEVNDFVPYTHATLLSPKNDLQGKCYINKIHILYVGRIDVMLEESLLWVCDHKTSSRGGKEFEDAFRLSLQTRGYCWAAQKLIGREVAGCILNSIIIRPPTRTGKNTEYNRQTYFYSQDSLLEWEQNMKALVQDLINSLIRGYFPQTARSFRSPCSLCDYSENCTLPLNQRALDLASDLYRDVTWDPTT